MTKFTTYFTSPSKICWLPYIHTSPQSTSLKELLVDDTGFTEEEKIQAISKAANKIDDVIDSMKF